jgi:hypothetical protein
VNRLAYCRLGKGCVIFDNIVPTSRTIGCPPRPKLTIINVGRRALLAVIGSIMVSPFSFALDNVASSKGGDFEQRINASRTAYGLPSPSLANLR